jgi:periplasmic divalent cation tolerance protein
MTDYIQVVTTTETRDQAKRIATHLVDLRLAGCVQVSGPLTSTYRWQGSVETAEEWACAVKTAADLYPAVEREIRALHAYNVPEILAFPVVSGHRAYLEWLADTLQG